MKTQEQAKHTGVLHESVNAQWQEVQRLRVINQELLETLKMAQKIIGQSKGHNCSILCNDIEATIAKAGRGYQTTLTKRSSAKQAFPSEK